ncbi:MAG: ABC transporter ATP-binding protein [Actinobacteria bacterium]|nr:ABC transporter ATP-binding protein [Actinomycetota bacterium]
MSSPAESVVEVDELTVDFWERDHWVNVVNKVSFSIEPGETLGLVGESGCGKSTTAFSLFGYRRPGSRVRSGAIRFDGRDLLRLKERELRSIRGARICLVPQNPAGSLTPSMRVGTQLVETLKAHRASTWRKAEKRAVELFAQVGLPEPGEIAERYPYELSGGQQQRVVMAMALACSPSLLVLDEPTTALDVTTQARILKLLFRLQGEHGMSMLYVTHNLGVVAQICDRVAVMYAGELVEIAPTVELFENPRHPYTRGLIAAVPRISAPTGGDATLRGLLRREELPDGCRFAPRCAYAQTDCFTNPQSLAPVAKDHRVACWLWKSIPGARRVAAEEPAQATPVPR